MKILTDRQARELIRSIDPLLDADNYGSLAKSGYQSIQLKLPPVDALNYLSKLLASSSEGSPWVIALLTDWSIFESDEDLYLYYQFRRSLGNQDHIIDGPGHLFLNFESHELRSLITLSMINAWDLLVVNNHDTTRYKTSHDGFVDLVSNDVEFMRSIAAFKAARNL